MTNEPPPPPSLDDLRAMMVDVVGSAVADSQRQIGAQLGALQVAIADLRKVLVEVQVDVALALDKLDVVEIDVRDVKAHHARVSREHIRDRLRGESLDQRIAEIERRLDAVEGSR